MNKDYISFVAFKNLLYWFILNMFAIGILTSWTFHIYIKNECKFINSLSLLLSMKGNIGTPLFI